MKTEPRSILWYLRKLPIFSALPRAALRVLGDATALRQLSRRTLLHLPGDDAEHVYCLHGGRVCVLRSRAPAARSTSATSAPATSSARAASGRPLHATTRPSRRPRPCSRSSRAPPCAWCSMNTPRPNGSWSRRRWRAAMRPLAACATP
ncbi:hypothetical protein [Nannocystis pusilla]|uniref:hypothetical protein n=1 Tax=Nannocystis pusilla TaxID=889268 RepID=UPI003B7F7D35